MTELNAEDLDLTGSIFDEDIDVDEIPDNPNHLPAGTYVCRITEAEMKLTAKKDKVGLTVKYQIIEGEYSSAWPFTEWLWVPRKSDPDSIEKTRALSRLKNHFKAYGFGADQYGKVTPDRLVNAIVKVRTRNQNENTPDERISVNGVYAVEEGASAGVDGVSEDNESDI